MGKKELCAHTDSLLGMWRRWRCILIAGSREVPESGAGPKEGISGTQMRAVQHGRKSRSQTWSWGQLGSRLGSSKWTCVART